MFKLMTAAIAAALMVGTPRDVFAVHADGNEDPYAATAGGTAVAVPRTVRCDPGHGPRKPVPGLPTIEIAFARESYRPGSTARLRVFSGGVRVRLRVFRAGAERYQLGASSVMDGKAVTPRRWLGTVAAGDSAWVHIGNWRSGVYFARVTGAGGRIGYAPFVLRPRRLGANAVAVVLPTQTWQAYNYRDDDADGWGDTWYCNGNTARLARPFEYRGVPRGYKWFDQPFLRWLYATRRSADYLADSDLDSVGNGRALRRAYELLAFPGHHEYVTEREYRAVAMFRDLGGNLAFLSANNFYWRIVRRGDLMIRTQQWRDLGRPEARIVGVEYVHSDLGFRRGPWIVRSRRAAPWLFASTRLRRGSMFGSGGIEVDAVVPASPRELKVLAEIPGATGPGYTAQMTYYERDGAKVFAAGAFSLAGDAWNPHVRPLLDNLWKRLSRP